MDFQNKPPKEIIDILKNNNVEYWCIDYYAYPETFGSTSGPRGGIGGCAMSKFTVDAWVCNDSGPTIFVCNGMYSFDDSRFEIGKNIKIWTKINASQNQD